MPEANQKLAVLGLKKAEKDFGRYLEGRVAAEHSTDSLEAELDKTGRDVGRAFEEVRRGG